MNKWDYLRSPIIEKYFISCFDIGEVPGSPGKLNWNLLSFLPFIFIFEQCGRFLPDLNMRIFARPKTMHDPRTGKIPMTKKVLK